MKVSIKLITSSAGISLNEFFSPVVGVFVLMVMPFYRYNRALLHLSQI
jgi:hypothetical protein